MIDLKEICEDIYTVNEFEDMYNVHKEQRARDGVSNIDIQLLGDFLDEVIYNALNKFSEIECTQPEGLNENEWQNYLENAIALSSKIVENNNALNSLSVDEMYNVDICNILAENYAYRAELLEMLNDIWEYLYV